MTTPPHIAITHRFLRRSSAWTPPTTTLTPTHMHVSARLPPMSPPPPHTHTIHARTCQVATHARDALQLLQLPTPKRAVYPALPHQLYRHLQGDGRKDTPFGWHGGCWEGGYYWGGGAEGTPLRFEQQEPAPHCQPASHAPGCMALALSPGLHPPHLRPRHPAAWLWQQRSRCCVQCHQLQPCLHANAGAPGAQVVEARVQLVAVGVQVRSAVRRHLHTG